jgi:hypothetical protein
MGKKILYHTNSLSKKGKLQCRYHIQSVEQFHQWSDLELGLRLRLRLAQTYETLGQVSSAVDLHTLGKNLPPGRSSQ